jgi:DNA-directed RNA polymerase subunit RPC12/RpoP
MEAGALQDREIRCPLCDRFFCEVLRCDGAEQRFACARCGTQVMVAVRGGRLFVKHASTVASLRDSAYTEA